MPSSRPQFSVAAAIRRDGVAGSALSASTRYHRATKLGDHRVQRVPMSAGHHHSGSVADELVDGGAAQSAGTTGDEVDLVLQFQIHEADDATGRDHQTSQEERASLRSSMNWVR